MKRSLHSDEPSNDWFSDALTPASLKREPTPVKELPPVEAMEEVESEVVKQNTTLAIHMDLIELFEKETT